jgi:hypothetical protein
MSKVPHLASLTMIQYKLCEYVLSYKPFMCLCVGFQAYFTKVEVLACPTFIPVTHWILQSRYLSKIYCLSYFLVLVLISYYNGFDLRIRLYVKLPNPKERHLVAAVTFYARVVRQVFNLT